MKASGGRVPKPKGTTHAPTWAIHCKWAARTSVDLRGWPLMVYPKTYGVHVHKLKRSIVSESGKKMVLPQIIEAMEGLPDGTDAYLTLGDIRSEFAQTQCQGIGQKRVGTFSEPLNVWVIDYNTPGNWLHRMQLLEKTVEDAIGEENVGRFRWMHRLGIGCMNYHDYLNAEAQFLMQGLGAVECRRVCPEYEAGHTMNVFMSKRFVRKVARVVSIEHLPYTRRLTLTFAPKTFTAQAIEVFTVDIPLRALATPVGTEVRVLVNNLEEDRAAPLSRVFYHGRTSDPLCTGATERQSF